MFLGRDFSSNPDYSPQVAFEIDREVTMLIDQAHDEALEILTGYRSSLDHIAQVLLDQETIEKDQLMEMLAEVPKRAPRKVGSPGGGIAVARREMDHHRRDAGPPGAID